jgi:hypothetical protein
VCADWPGPGGEDPYDDASPFDPSYYPRPAGMRPAGMRPAGMRPAGMRPAGMRPAGMRPAGMRPAGMRPAGMRPAGMRPAGMRPAGMRPAGMRPAGMRAYDDAGDPYLDADEWSADVAALFCESSAVLRLGASVAFDLHELPFAHPPVLGRSDYLPEPVVVEDDDASVVAAGHGGAGLAGAGAAAQQATSGLWYRRLKPSSHELVIQIAVRNRLVSTIVEHPEVAWALKRDIASALAFRADEGFLRGHPKDRAPRGIASMKDTIKRTPGGNALDTARDMVSALRSSGARFVNPGWVLHPNTLDQLGDVLKALPAANDGGQLLTYDGADGGTLLGYAYIVSAATNDPTVNPPERMFFASDWTEAWIAAQDPLVTVDVSSDVLLASDETVIRAVTQHDFALRAPSAFVYTKQGPPTPAPAVNGGGRAVVEGGGGGKGGGEKSMEEGA